MIQHHRGHFTEQGHVVADRFVQDSTPVSVDGERWTKKLHMRGETARARRRAKRTYRLRLATGSNPGSFKQWLRDA